MDVRFLASVVVASAGLLLPGASLVCAQTAPARFVTVDQGDDELAADDALARGLGPQLVGSPDQLSYDAVINALLDDARRDNPLARTGGVVARVTPYAFVVAEMRGAKVELLATCVSRSTARTVTNAFLVVPQSAFPGAPPTLEQVLDRLKSLSAADRPARFIYHNKYSTSSYFLPSLLFRARRVFGQFDRTTKPSGVTMIGVERNESPSSSDLIRAVATQQPDGRETIASVWDGPRSGFADANGRHFAEYGRKVHFVPLPDDLPCDLLVATRKVADTTKDAINARLQSLRTIAEVPGSDVGTWVPWSNVEAEDARRALSNLRRQAGSSTWAVVVDVQTNRSSPVDGDLLDAARLAIRLSGTELVDRSQYFDYYKKSDIRWELESIHDGAVRLTVRYENFRLDGTEVTQQFDVSYQEPADFTRRLVSLVHSRLHRIRPVWLYNDSAPTVLRDVDFDVARRVPFQEILWHEPQRNDYRLAGESRVATVEKQGTFEIQLATAEFPRRPDNRSLDFEPMGRQGFRVLLMRVTPERTLFRALTIAFVVLLGLGAAALVWDAWRWRARRRARAVRRGGATAAASVSLPSDVPPARALLESR
jgi:hypothetical protein